MQVYHLGNSRFARQMTGEGARLFGGRWNLKGDACIYTSASRSLCLLEYAANVSLGDLPPGLAITVYNIPDKTCRLFSVKDLPEDWNEIPAPLATKQFGSALLSDANCVCFGVPSVVVPAEMNFILNPLADEFKKVEIVSIEQFTFDQRIKL
jgi:RES domain-containing protein